MKLTDKVYENVYTILKQISTNEDISDAEINFYGELGKGQGFMGDVIFVDIIDKKTNKKLELVIKQSTSSEYVRNNFPIQLLYRNESQFYTKIWPEWLNLQTLHLGSVIFNNLAKCYATDTEAGREYLILDNLKAQNYSSLNKNTFFDKEHAEYVLKTYGKFHGMSFVCKSKNPEKFSDLRKLLTPYWFSNANIELFKILLIKGMKRCLMYLENSTDNNLKEVMKRYENDVISIFQNSTVYNGNNGVFLHGDCWSNNIFFKYNECGKLKDMKLIDFQMSDLGSVVNDLSYSLYAGGTKDIFDNLNYYLQVYHDSLSDTCSKFGCTNFLSLEELKSEWKTYSKFGFILGLMLIESKLSEDVDQDELAEIGIKEGDNQRKCDEKEIKKKSLELVYHMYENDFL